MKVSVATGNIYERNRWLYILTMPISLLMTLWVMIKQLVSRVVCRLVGGKLNKKATNSIFFDHFAEKLRLIKEGSASWKALDVIYNHKFGKNRTVVGWLEDFWIGMMNAQSVRNRFKLIKIKLKETLLKFRREPEVRMISIACGSAQAVIEVISELKKEGVIVRVFLVDMSREALAHAENLAVKHGIADQIETRRLNVIKTAIPISDFKPHVVEMLGLLDYLDRKTAVKFIGDILNQMPREGIFLTCNIRHNLEMFFLWWVINWPMIYRSPKELQSIITEAGFSEVEIVYEPLNIHGIVIAKKS